MTVGQPTGPFWHALTESQRAALLHIGARRVYQSEQVLLREFERSDFAVVLLEGCVKVSTTARRGYRAILGLRDAGELVGELAGVDGEPRSATLTALTKVVALILPSAPFGSFLRDQPEAAAILRRTLSARLREADDSRAAAGAEPAQQRLATLLLWLGNRYGTSTAEGGLAIELPLSQEDLAGLALTSQRTLGRILEQWRNRGLVLTGRRRILLCLPARLGQIAAGLRDG